MTVLLASGNEVCDGTTPVIWWPNVVGSLPTVANPIHPDADQLGLYAWNFDGYTVNSGVSLSYDGDWIQFQTFITIVSIEGGSEWSMFHCTDTGDIGVAYAVGLNHDGTDSHISVWKKDGHVTDPPAYTLLATSLGGLITGNTYRLNIKLSMLPTDTGDDYRRIYVYINGIEYVDTQDDDCVPTTQFSLIQQEIHSDEKDPGVSVTYDHAAWYDGSDMTALGGDDWACVGSQGYADASPNDFTDQYGSGHKKYKYIDDLNKENTVLDSGTAEVNGVGNDELLDSDKAWDANEWDGYVCFLTGGTGSGQSREILSNTADTLTLASNWDTNPDATTQYEIKISGYISGGVGVSQAIAMADTVQDPGATLDAVMVLTNADRTFTACSTGGVSGGVETSGTYHNKWLPETPWAAPWTPALWDALRFTFTNCSLGWIMCELGGKNLLTIPANDHGAADHADESGCPAAAARRIFIT